LSAARRFALGRGLPLGSALGRTIGRELNVAWLPRLLGVEVGEGVVLHARSVAADAVVADGAVVDSEVLVGYRVTIGRDATVRRRAVLASDVDVGAGGTVGEGARLQNLSLGEWSMIECDVVCLGYGDGRIVIGRESYVGIRNVLDWSDDIQIGDHVHIAGPSTALWTHSSVEQARHGDALSDKHRRTTAPIRICDNVYVGGNCTVYPGVTIGAGAVILPNSAVDCDVPPGVLAGGVPVKVVRTIDTGDESDSD
jgi:acetyltransferase-like isoleucine patch superfamily enzyme